MGTYNTWDFLLSNNAETSLPQMLSQYVPGPNIRNGKDIVAEWLRRWT